MDMDLRKEPPLEDKLNFWPIQTASQNHIRWASWRKQFGAALFGMPLWNIKELMEGYVSSSFDRGLLPILLRLCCSVCLHPGYNDFRGRLETSLPLPDEPMLPDELMLPDKLTFHVTDDEAFNAALKVLQTGREKKGVEEDHDETDDGISASVAGQDQIVADVANVAGKPQASADEVDDALKILVRNVTEEFGFIPRDVYNGVFYLPSTRDEHASAMKGHCCSELVILVETFSKHRTLHGVSDKVVVVYPRKSLTHHDLWGMNFKSDRIAEEVMGSMPLAEDKHLRGTYAFLHKFPEGSTLAGWVFEAIVHRVLSGGWLEGPALQPILMASNQSDPPNYKTPLPSPHPFPSYPRHPTATLRATRRKHQGRHAGQPRPSLPQ